MSNEKCQTAVGMISMSSIRLPDLLLPPLFEPIFLDFEIDFLHSFARAHDFDTAQELENRGF